MASYDYLNQDIVASQLIQVHNDDSFYMPESNRHYGFAADGQFYQNGVLATSPPQSASWFNESAGPYRGSVAVFPTAGLILLSPASLVILDESKPTLDATQLTLWMQFILADVFALTDNFDGALNGWTPAGLTYANGLISVIYNPDSGNEVNSPPLAPPQPATSIMVVTIDFSQDSVYLDVAL